MSSCNWMCGTLLGKYLCAKPAVAFGIRSGDLTIVNRCAEHDARMLRLNGTYWTPFTSEEERDLELLRRQL